MTFGKVMGGGFPAAAFGGRADVMAHARRRRGRSTRPAPCRGTRSRPPPGWPRCGWPPTRSTPTSTRPPRPSREAAAAALTAAGVPHVVQAAGNMFSVFFLEAASVPDPNTGASTSTLDKALDFDEQESANR